MQTNSCKICRRAGAKLFLKGDRCYQQKCAMVRRSYAPGKKGKRRTRSSSEYGIQLLQKQKLKRFYNLREQQFKNYVKKVLAKKSEKADLSGQLISILESRLDNTIFRLGFASSRPGARQLVNHNNFLVNGKPVNIPSYQVKQNDIIAVAPGKAKNKYFTNLANSLKTHKTPSWLTLNADKMEGKVSGAITIEEIEPISDIGTIFEFYAR